MLTAFLPLAVLMAVVCGLLASVVPTGAGAWAAPGVAGGAPAHLATLLIETLALAGCALLVAVPISGALAANLYAVASRTARTRMLALARLTAELPPLLVALAVLALLGGPVDGGLGPVDGWLGRVAAGATLGLWLVPATTLAARDALARVPRRLYRSAIVLGAAPVDALRVVVLPVALPRLGAVALSALTRCLAEGLIVGVVGGALLAGPGPGPVDAPSSLATALLDGHAGWAAIALLLAVLQIGLHRSSRALIHRARREAEA
jgi:ABC-type phosphate transport system permease subunit